jgi:hemolysin activation/secretion protein
LSIFGRERCAAVGSAGKAARQWLLAALLGGVLPAPALAQTVLPTREELAPAQQAPLARAQAQQGVVGRLEAGPCPFADSPLTFTLRDVEFAGLTAVNPARLLPTWSDARGREIPVSELCAIRDRAAQMLIDQGYLARVEIPPQEIAGGHVRFQVYEAHITKVTVQGGDEGARRAVQAYMSRLDGLAPLDLDVVQRQILLASDVPGVRLATNVRPALEGQGAVELVVDVQHRAVDALAAVQTFGSEEVGPVSAVARVDLNSLSPLGERTSLVVSSTTDWREQWVVQLLEEMRLGGSGLLGRASLAYAESKPGGAIEALGIESKSTVASFELAYPIVRTRRQNLWVSGGLEVVDQQTDIFDGLAAFTHDELRVLSLRLEGDGRGYAGDRAFAYGWGLELRQGIDALGASGRGDALLSRADADPEAFVIRADARAEMQIAGALSLATGVIGQWTDQPLLSYEEQAIGNYSVGRGYEPGAASGDRVVGSSIELRYGGLFSKGGVSASGYAFYDGAWIENLDSGSASGERILKSIGGGIRVALDSAVTLDLAYAHPLDAPFAGAPKPAGRVLLNLVTRFR